MKDLITTIGAVVILIVFVLQFANNQAIATRVIAADSLCDGYFSQSANMGEAEASETSGTASKRTFNAVSKEELISRLAGILNCNPSDISVEQGLGNNHVKAYIGNVIACADFLGISAEENRAEYQYFSAGNEEGEDGTDIGAGKTAP